MNKWGEWFLWLCDNCEGYHSCMVVLASLGKENKKEEDMAKKLEMNANEP